jgi:phosphatidylglycerol:prolipoprotein diacylglycerol transferase
MAPVLFRIPGIGYEVPGYGLALMIGFLLAIVWATHRAAKSGANPDVVLNCGFIALIAGVVGSRAMYVAHYWDDFAYRGHVIDVVWGILDVRRGGLEVYGGVLLVIAITAVYLWRWKHSFRWYLDIMAPSAALGMSIGRIGCLLNGCCWGGVCELPWATQFPFASPPAVQQWTDRVPGAALPKELLVMDAWPNGQQAIPIPREALRASNEELNAAARTARAARDIRQLRMDLLKVTDEAEKQRIRKKIAELQKTPMAKPSAYVQAAAQVMAEYDLTAEALRALARKHPSLPVHPTQAYSVITLGLVAWLLGALYWRRTRDGQVICLFLAIEPPSRWALEVLRADNPVDTAGLTISQFLAIVISLLGILGLIWLRTQPPRSPRAVLWEPPEEESAPKARSGAASAGK